MNFEEMYNAAHAAGVAAAEAANVELIGIAGRPDYGTFPICGFAWITLRPANSSFARWVAKNRGAHKAHGGGLMVWVGGYDQSYARKMAYASGFAKELQKLGIRAEPGGRLD